MSAKYDFSGRKVLVTGGSRGIGRALAIALAQSNAQVVIVHSCDTDKLEPFYKDLCITSVQCDLSQSKVAIQKALQPHLPFHGLVNNAGIALFESFLEVTGDCLQRTMAINTQAALFVSQIVAKSMIEHNIKGSIINVSSQASLLPLHKHTTYCSSKAALDSLTRSMTLELGPHGIRTNSINPTVVLTDMGMHWKDPKKGGPMLQRIPMNRFAEVDEVVQPCLFLLSDGAAMISGITLSIDGGFANT